MTSRGDDRHARESGQATSEYVGLVLMMALVLGAVLTLAGPVLPGGELARAIATRLLCAVGSSRHCDPGTSGFQVPATEAAYGPEIAAMLAESAPDIFFEGDDFASLPVDFRECRSRACADTIRLGPVHATQTGLPPVVFTHIVDCREQAATPNRSAEYDCSGERAGRIYLQYWLYYPDSLTHGLGRVGGFHDDDWESLQVRIDPGEATMARASSHHGYNGRSGGIGSIGSDTGWSPKSGWDTSLNALHVASGSHAGTTEIAYGDSRAIHREDLILIPAEPLAGEGGVSFAVSPPWEKAVWGDPEAMGT
jgi:hypothetical protein